MADAILIAIIAAPLILAYVLKGSASLAFLSLCAGFVVQSFAVNDIKNLLNLTASSFVTTDTLSALLIMLPLVLTLFLCRGPSSRKLSNPRVWLNLLTAIGAGGALALMAVPFFDYVGSVRLTDSQTWNVLNRGQSEIIGLGVLLALINLWLVHRKPRGTSKHHK